MNQVYFQMATKLYKLYCDKYLVYGYSWASKSLEEEALWYEYKWYRKKYVEQWYGEGN